MTTPSSPAAQSGCVSLDETDNGMQWLDPPKQLHFIISERFVVLLRKHAEVGGLHVDVGGLCEVEQVRCEQPALQIIVLNWHRYLTGTSLRTSIVLYYPQPPGEKLGEEAETT